MGRNPGTRGGRATPIGRRPTGPGSRCRLTKKIPISTRPTQNCGRAMPLSVAPRTRKSGQRSRFTAAITPTRVPGGGPNKAELERGRQPVRQIRGHALAGSERGAEIEAQQLGEIVEIL